MKREIQRALDKWTGRRTERWRRTRLIVSCLNFCFPYNSKQSMLMKFKMSPNYSIFWWYHRFFLFLFFCVRIWFLNLKTTNCTRPTGSWGSLTFQKSTCPDLSEITLVSIMCLPIQMKPFQVTNSILKINI